MAEADSSNGSSPIIRQTYKRQMWMQQLSMHSGSQVWQGALERSTPGCHTYDVCKIDHRCYIFKSQKYNSALHFCVVLTVAWTEAHKGIACGLG